MTHFADQHICNCKDQVDTYCVYGLVEGSPLVLTSALTIIDKSRFTTSLGVQETINGAPLLPSKKFVIFLHGAQRLYQASVYNCLCQVLNRQCVSRRRT